MTSAALDASRFAPIAALAFGGWVAGIWLLCRLASFNNRSEDSK